MKLSDCPLHHLGIPQDVIDAAEQVGLDAVSLVKLCIAHSVQAARDFLTGLAGKLPAK